MKPGSFVFHPANAHHYDESSPFLVETLRDS